MKASACIFSPVQKRYRPTDPIFPCITELYSFILKPLKLVLVGRKINQSLSNSIRETIFPHLNDNQKRWELCH